MTANSDSEVASISVHVSTLLALYEQGHIRQSALLLILPVQLWNKVLESGSGEPLSIEGVVQ
jgi:hypothetical protein